MSDIPQLRSDLVAAGSRRNRRARVRKVALGAAVMALGVGALTRLDAPPEREVAVPAERSDAQLLEEAFGVFRRPARRADRYPGRVFGAPPRGRPRKPVRSRLVARVGDRRYYLVLVEDGLCLVIQDGSGGCGNLKDYLDGRRPHGSYSDEEGPADLVFVFPDGVKDVSVLTTAGEVRDLRVRDNAIATRVSSRAVELRWTAPDGTPQRIQFHPAPAVQPGDYYSTLARADEYLVAEDEDIQASLANRGGRVCLRVVAAAESLEGCRDKPADVRRALVVLLQAGERRVLAAAFTDGVSQVGLLTVGEGWRPLKVRDNAVLVADATDADAIRYRNRAKVKVVDRFPASARSAVLNGEPRR